MSRLDYVRDLHRLRHIAEGRSQGDLGRVEQELLALASAAREAEEVRQPTTPGGEAAGPGLYALRGEEAAHHALGLESLGLDTGGRSPGAVDASGWHGDLPPGPAALVLLSPRQELAARPTGERAWLWPVVQEVYRSAAALLQDFTVQEAVVARVTVSRGALDLTRLPHFPERFFPGPFLAHVRLDTPTGVVARLTDLMRRLERIQQDPGLLLDQLLLQDLVSEALDLRRPLGPLARYRVPGTQELRVELSSCVVRYECGPCSFLWASGPRRNVLVHHGQVSPLSDRSPPGLMVLDGSRGVATLRALLELGLLAPDPRRLAVRIQRLRALLGGAAEGAAESCGQVRGLVAELVGLMQRLDPGDRPGPGGRLSGAALELALGPAREDPVLEQLLPHLSAFESVRLSHDHGELKRRLEGADEHERPRLRAMARVARLLRA